MHLLPPRYALLILSCALRLQEEDMARLLPPKAELIVMKLASKALLYFDARPLE